MRRSPRRYRRPDSVRDLEWDTWRASDPATLVFIVKNDSLLLIRKKRGLGAGKINGPGGRLELGESPLQGAIREVREELGITPLGLRVSGENRFQFTSGYSILVHVFRASDFQGEPRETDEAVPLWVSTGQIPYDQMWEDDRLWIPHLLSGTYFSGRYLFDGDTLIDHELEIFPHPPG